MDEMVHGSLRITTSSNEGNIKVSFFGKSDSRVPANILNPIFDKILKDLDGNLTLEFDNLEFMNSSTMPPLAQFIIKLEDKKIKSQVLYDSNCKWQNITFGVLKKLTGGFKYVSIVGR